MNEQGRGGGRGAPVPWFEHRLLLRAGKAGDQRSLLLMQAGGYPAVASAVVRLVPM